MLRRHTRRFLIIIGVALLLIGVAPMVAARFRLNFALVACAKVTHGQPISCSLQVNSQDSRASYHLGLNAWWAGALPQTIKYLTEHLAQDPKDQVAGLYLGMAYRQNGNESEALAVWRQTGAISYFTARGWRDGSVDDFQTAIAAGETEPAVFYKLGDVLWDAGRRQEAGVVYRQGINLETHETFRTMLARGRLLELTEDWRGALAWYGRCAQAAQSLPCYLAAGEIERKDGNYRAALEWGSEAQTLFPNNSAPLIFIGLTWEVQGIFSEAATAYKRAAEVDPGNFWIPYYQGYLSIKADNCTAAVKFFGQSAELNPTSPGVQLGMGTALRQCGQVKDAIQAYRRALELSPDEPLAEQALKELAP